MEGFIHCIIIENLCVKGYTFLQSNTFRFNFRVLTRMLTYVSLKDLLFLFLVTVLGSEDTFIEK